jgi:hypothetical protein
MSLSVLGHRGSKKNIPSGIFKASNIATLPLCNFHAAENLRIPHAACPRSSISLRKQSALVEFGKTYSERCVQKTEGKIYNDQLLTFNVHKLQEMVVFLFKSTSSPLIANSPFCKFQLTFFTCFPPTVTTAGLLLVTPLTNTVISVNFCLTV